jgi:hypothetical protein
MENKFDQFASWYRALPEKKKYIEFVTAVLSVPVMVTVIIINLNNLNQQKSATQKQSGTEKTTPIQVVISGEKENKNTTNEDGAKLVETPTQAPSPTKVGCIKEVGPVSVVSPRENEVLKKSPVCVTISTQSDYCSLVWAYSLDSDDWSTFSDKTICFYGLDNGTHAVQIKIKSSVSDDETTLQRSFVYQGNVPPTATPTVASSSAGM